MSDEIKGCVGDPGDVGAPGRDGGDVKAWFDSLHARLDEFEKRHADSVAEFLAAQKSAEKKINELTKLAAAGNNPSPRETQKYVI